MKLPEGVKPEDVLGPTGIYSKNPTHYIAGKRVKSQNELIAQIRQAGKQRLVEVVDYTTDDKQILPGFKEIIDLSEEEVLKLCKTLFKSRPNIFAISFKLGDFPSTKRLTSQKVTALSSRVPRHSNEVAERFADLLYDKSLRVVEVSYTVENATPGQFTAVAEAVGCTSEEEYRNPEFLHPVLVIEYISN